MPVGYTHICGVGTVESFRSAESRWEMPTLTHTLDCPPADAESTSGSGRVHMRCTRSAVAPLAGRRPTAQFFRRIGIEPGSRRCRVVVVERPVVSTVRTTMSMTCGPELLACSVRPVRDRYCTAVRVEGAGAGQRRARLSRRPRVPGALLPAVLRSTTRGVRRRDSRRSRPRRGPRSTSRLRDAAERCAGSTPHRSGRCAGRWRGGRSSRSGTGRGGGGRGGNRTLPGPTGRGNAAT